jgi:F-type H+-transporting ATPase subunit gamma
MSGTGLAAIKKRIKSITKITKITKSMGLVATAKYKKIKYKVDINNNYLHALEETIKKLSSNYEEDSIYIQGSSNKKKLYIILTSDTGLCGGFNWAVINRVMDTVKASGDDYKVIIIGKKGSIIFKKLKIETVAEYVEILDIPSQREATEIMSLALSMYDKGDIGEVYIVYKKLISALQNEVKIEKLLPLSVHTNEKHNKEYVDISSIDESGMRDLISLYLNGKMLNSMLHSRASEHRARMESMGAATSNADELLKKLKLSYNRTRQSTITQEIAEIVGGAEALK